MRDFGYCEYFIDGDIVSPQDIWLNSVMAFDDVASLNKAIIKIITVLNFMEYWLFLPMSHIFVSCKAADKR